MHFTLTEHMRACLRQILKDANNKLTKEKEVFYILKSSETVQKEPFKMIMKTLARSLISN